jgi:hypothetical protein
MCDVKISDSLDSNETGPGQSQVPQQAVHWFCPSDPKGCPNYPQMLRATQTLSIGHQPRGPVRGRLASYSPVTSSGTTRIRRGSPYFALDQRTERHLD